MRAALPLAVFGALLLFLAAGLRRDPRLIPSPLIGHPAPLFDLPRLDRPGKRFSPVEMRGRVWLLNTWASWCVSCRQEHVTLVELARSKHIPIYGLNYKDDRANALEWLERWGNPYVLSVEDADGRVGIDYGVYGVPETYLIDKEGVIRYKQIGPLTRDVIDQTILPMAAELN